MIQRDETLAVNLQVSERNKGRNMKVINIHGTRGHEACHGLERLQSKVLVLDLLREHVQMLFDERNHNTIVIILQIFLLEENPKVNYHEDALI